MLDGATAPPGGSAAGLYECFQVTEKSVPPLQYAGSARGSLALGVLRVDGVTRSAEVSSMLRRWEARSPPLRPVVVRAESQRSGENEVSEAEESSQRPDPVVRDGGNRHSDRAGTGLELQ